MNQIKSKERVKKLGEVFTNDREVDAMLNLLPADEFLNPLATFLEPACGTGNFLVAILRKKLSYADGLSEPEDIYSLKVLSSLYGVDIDCENVQQTKSRLKALMLELVNSSQAERFQAAIDTILHTNIRQGDFLKGIEFQPYYWDGALVSSDGDNWQEAL
ncbi:hypothetical protein [Roseateles sp. PN1]|uniref:hypothetical protein n=1 Tax=Roseateles sp. PN1 TaxID=3137372 RepID=UPI00313872A5